MTNLPIPIQVLYAGLAGTVLALIVATIQNRWSLRVFFILALRLAIGWHFLFEGLNKVHSHYLGPTETNRPFSSEPYFKDADGPLAPYMSKQIGDPEALLKQKTEPASVPDRLAKITDPNLRLASARLEAERRVTAKSSSNKEVAAQALADEQAADAEFAKAVPASVRKEWDEFAKGFVEKFKLSEKDRNRFDGTLDGSEQAELAAARELADLPARKENEAKREELLKRLGPGDLTLVAMAKYGKWVTGAEGRDSKVKFVSGDTPLSAPQRLDYIKHRKTDLDELLKRPAAELGKGGVDVTRIKEAKSLVSAARTVLIADADAFLADLKRDAFTTILNERLEQPSDDPAKAVVPPSKFVGKDDARLDALLKDAFLQPQPGPSFDLLPAPLRERWSNFHREFKALYPLTANAEAAVDEEFGLIKTRLANWYCDRDEFTGTEPKPGFGRLARAYQAAKTKADANPKDAAAEVEVGLARAAALSALDAKYADLRTLLTATLPADVVKTALEPAENTDSYIKTLDRRTRWMLVAVGTMLLAGLFTRLACVVGGAFLVLTYLTHPPFPWLPLPPGTEGTPIFVNKNVIEFLGLMVILVHPTGRWMGLDALIHRTIFRNDPDPK